MDKFNIFINDIEYTPVYDPVNRCDGCVGEEDDAICNSLPFCVAEKSCTGTDIIWVEVVE